MSEGRGRCAQSRFETVHPVSPVAFVAAFHLLTALMKDVSMKVVERGGVVRSIRNHGIRTLPSEFRSSFPDKEGNRNYRKGRFISIYYDSNPQTMREVESILRINDQVLRDTHLKARNKLWYVNIAREDRNPYIQKVIELESAAAAAAAGGQEEAEPTS